MSRERLTRRQALKGLGIAAAGALLAACQPKVVEKEKVVRETVIVGGTPHVVEKVVTATPAPKPTPEIWIYRHAVDCPGGGNPEQTERVRKFILDHTGVKVNAYLTPAGTAAVEKLNMILASATQPLDLFTSWPTGGWELFRSVILPLDDLLQQHGKNILRMYPELAWKMMKDVEGTTWGYPFGSPTADDGFIFFRSDWLQEIGKPVPTTWWQETPVTWEELEEVISAFRKAHPDSVAAINGLGNLQTSTLGAFTEHGKSRWVDPADKMLKPFQLQPGFREWVERMSRWWQNGWLHKECFANMDVTAVLKTLTVGTWLGYPPHICKTWDDIRKDAKYTKENYIMIEQLRGPKGLAKVNSGGSTTAYMLARKSKYPEAAIRYIDWVHEGLPKDVTAKATVRLGMEGHGWKWADKEKGTYYDLRQFMKCEDKYGGEFAMHMARCVERYGSPLNPDGTFKWSLEQIQKYVDRFDLGKNPVDMDVPYDLSRIRQKFPGVTDFERLLEEETIKFITGARPLSDWSNFLKQIDAAGLKKWSEVYTEQYRMYHPA